MEFYHVPVMPDETVAALDIKPGGTYVDATTGGGNHSLLIAQRLKGGRLICIDQDQQALNAAEEKLKEFKESIVLEKANFRHLHASLSRLAPMGIDGILFDLGVSSHQLDNPQRGFSYSKDAPLDMRMAPDTQATSAFDVVNSYSQHELRRIISEYGEERYAASIAFAIAKSREKQQIKTTLELVEIIRNAMPKKALREKQHPAKRTFQAIRIEVNAELDAISEGLRHGVQALRPGGRIAVISFHSLEDRIVKRAFSQYAKGCDCPKSAPICICGKKPELKLITKGAQTATEQEAESNPRARSAKLRAAEKLPSQQKT